MSWYGLLLQLPGCQVFVLARPDPPEIDEFRHLLRCRRNRSRAATRKADPKPQSGQSERAFDPAYRSLSEFAHAVGRPTRKPLQATVRHAKFLSFQLEDEIKTDMLFHRQNDPTIAQAIKDTLPYFLGVVPEDRLRVQQELREARRRLKQLERRLAESDAVSGNAATQAAGLLQNAQAVGLQPPGELPSDTSAMLEALKPFASHRRHNNRI